MFSIDEVVFLNGFSSNYALYILLSVTAGQVKGVSS